MLADPIERDTEAPIKEPAKEWTNWWRLLGERAWYEGGRQFSRGDVFRDISAYPSKDIAESVAYADLAYNLTVGGAEEEYLGALPVGEKPEVK